MSRTHCVVKEPPRLYYNKFFTAIKQRPALWDSSHKDFRNIKATQILWNQVVKICGKGIGARAQVEFLRKRKIYENFLAGKLEHWAYASQMSFLNKEIVNSQMLSSPSKKAIESDSVEASAGEGLEDDFNLVDVWLSTPAHSPVQSLLSTPNPLPKRLKQESPRFSPIVKSLLVSKKKLAGFPKRQKHGISRMAPTHKKVTHKKQAAPPQRKEAEKENRAEYLDDLPYNLDSTIESLDSLVRMDDIDSDYDEMEDLQHDQTDTTIPSKEAESAAVAASINEGSLVRMDDIDSDDDEMEGLQHDQSDATIPSKEAEPAAVAASIDEIAPVVLAEQPLRVHAETEEQTKPVMEALTLDAQRLSETLVLPKKREMKAHEITAAVVEVIDLEDDEDEPPAAADPAAAAQAAPTVPGLDLAEEEDADIIVLEQSTPSGPSRRSGKVVAVAEQADSDIIVLNYRNPISAVTTAFQIAAIVAATTGRVKAADAVVVLDGPPAAPSAPTTTVSSRSERVEVIESNGETNASDVSSAHKIERTTPIDPIPDEHLNDNIIVVDQQTVAPAAAAAAAAAPRAPTIRVSSHYDEVEVIETNSSDVSSAHIDPIADEHLNDNIMMVDQQADAAASSTPAAPDASKTAEKKSGVQMAIDFQEEFYETQYTDLDILEKSLEFLKSLPFRQYPAVDQREEAESASAEERDETEEEAVVPPSGSAPPSGTRQRLARGAKDKAMFLSKTKKEGKKEARPSTAASNWARDFWRKAQGNVDTKMIDFSLPNSILGASEMKRKSADTQPDEKHKRKRGRPTKAEILQRTQAEEESALGALVESTRDIDEDQPSTSRGRVGLRYGARK